MIAARASSARASSSSRPAWPTLPDQQGPQPAEPLRRPVQPHRDAIRRARPGARGDLGPGDGLRRLHRASSRHIRSLATLAYDCRRSDKFRARTARRAAHRPARRHDPPHDARRLGGRDRADPVHAVVLHEVCGRFRRQRSARPRPQRAGRAGLDRQVSRELRMAARPGWDPGPAQFRRDPAMEQELGLQPHDRAAGRQDRRQCRSE